MSKKEELIAEIRELLQANSKVPEVITTEWLNSAAGRTFFNSAAGRTFFNSAAGWTFINSDAGLCDLPVSILESIKESLSN